MGNIRINLLARELEVKSHLILEYLAVLGIEKKSHSSALDDELADKVREHFRVLSEGGQAAEEAPAPPPPTPVVSKEPAAAVVEPRKLPDIIKAELQHPLTRSLEEIKNAARRAVIPPPLQEWVTFRRRWCSRRRQCRSQRRAGMLKPCPAPSPCSSPLFLPLSRLLLQVQP